MLEFPFTKTTHIALGEAARAIYARDLQALATASRYLGKKVPRRPDFVEPLILISKLLVRDKRYVEQAIEAARIAALYAPAGSPLEQRAVRFWTKHINKLPDATHKIEAARTATRNARTGSTLELQAITVAEKYSTRRPDGQKRR